MMMTMRPSTYTYISMSQAPLPLDPNLPNPLEEVSLQTFILIQIHSFILVIKRPIYTSYFHLIKIFMSSFLDGLGFNLADAIGPGKTHSLMLFEVTT